MNDISFSPNLYAGEFSLLALMLILVLVEILQKKPLFLLTNSLEFERRNKQAGLITAIGLGVVVLIIIFIDRSASGGLQIMLNNSLKVGAGSYVGKLTLVIATFLVILLSYRYIFTQAIPAVDYYLLIIFSLFGAITLINAEHFIVIFLALEMMSIPIYALVGLHRYKARAGESAIKYVLLGGFSSAFLLLGISFLYGISGSLVVSDVIKAVSILGSAASGETNTILAGLGFILVFIGLAFKVSLFPFHAWTPDVYEGASTPITAYMSVVVKLSAFAVMLKIFAGATHFIYFDPLFSTMITVFALLTVIYGNSVALVQQNIKRMLAYSSIAHAGYMALAIAPMRHSIEAVQAVLFYGIGYVAMNTLAFGVLIYLTSKDEYCENIADIRGLASRHPIAAAMMALAMFSLAGIPPAIGFAGKIQIFMQLMHANMFLTAIIALLASLVAFYFYLNIIVQMYMKPAEAHATEFEKTGSIPTKIALWTAAAFTLILGILPSWLMDWALSWAKTLY